MRKSSLLNSGELEIYADYDELWLMTAFGDAYSVKSKINVMLANSGNFYQYSNHITNCSRYTSPIVRYFWA